MRTTVGVGWGVGVWVGRGVAVGTDQVAVSSADSNTCVAARSALAWLEEAEQAASPPASKHTDNARSRLIEVFCGNRIKDFKNRNR